jgi:hypothetical protein
MSSHVNRGNTWSSAHRFCLKTLSNAPPMGGHADLREANISIAFLRLYRRHVEMKIERPLFVVKVERAARIFARVYELHRPRVRLRRLALVGRELPAVQQLLDSRF